MSEMLCNVVSWHEMLQCVDPLCAGCMSGLAACFVANLLLFWMVSLFVKWLVSLVYIITLFTGQPILDIKCVIAIYKMFIECSLEMACAPFCL